VFECAFEDCGNLSVCYQFSGGACRLVQPAIAANLNSTRKHLVGKQTNFLTLLHDCFDSGVGLRCQFRLVNLPVQALQALDTGHEFGF